MKIGAFFLFFVILSVGVSVQAADLFGHGPEGPAPSLSAEAHSPLPEPLRTVLGQMVSLQSQLNAQLRGQLRQARDGGSLSPVLAIIGLSFLYGVVHALGPGHGKLVVGSYFLSRRARLVHGLMMSGTAALVQALSAIALVSLLALVFDFGSQEIFAQAGTLETLSYFGITAVGLVMLWRVWQQKDCCHGGAHHHHSHGHEAPPASQDLPQLLAAAAAVGLRPCSGAILVLLFTLANQIYLVGVVASFAMGAGVAITVAGVSLASQGLQRFFDRAGGEGLRARRLQRLAGFVGALLITAFGLLQLLAIWSGALTPMAG